VTAAELAARLHARRSGSGWIAKCPAHPDRTPSLSVREGDAGRALIFCHAGCSVEAICAALKIKLSDLFCESGTYKPKSRIVRDAERQIQNLRSRLTPRERALPVTVVFCSGENLDAGIARALALTIQGEIVQCIFEEPTR
jgi:hypothetical protein